MNGGKTRIVVKCFAGSIRSGFAAVAVSLDRIPTTGGVGIDAQTNKRRIPQAEKVESKP